MNLIKYDKTRDANGNLIVSGSSSSQTTVFEQGGSRGGGDYSYSAELDRTIWGKYDDGGDVDGHMWVNGDVHIKTIIPPTYEPDEDDAEYDMEDDGDDIETDTGGGNLYVDGTGEFSVIKATNMTATANITGVNITASANLKGNITTTTTLNADTINFNYPNSTSAKQNLRTLFKDFDDRLNEIEDYGVRITNVENHQKDQDVMINANIGEILGIKGDIGRLENKIDSIEGGDCNCTGGGTSVVNGITTIDGNVNWKQMSRNDNFNSGFIFENMEGVVEFSPMDLYESFDLEDGGLPRRYASYTAMVQCLWDWDWETSQGTFYGVGYAQEIGYFNVGDTISVNTIQGRVIDWVDKTYNCQVTQMGWTISCNGQNRAGGNGVAFTHTCNMAGLYRVQFSVYGTHTKPRNSTIVQQDETICEITANYSLPEKDTQGQISPNGITYSYNNNRNYVFIGPDCTMMKYGNYGLKIDSSGIWKYNGSSWVRATI